MHSREEQKKRKPLLLTTSQARQPRHDITKPFPTRFLGMDVSMKEKNKNLCCKGNTWKATDWCVNCRVRREGGCL
jgi:hypothetical protein